MYCKKNETLQLRATIVNTFWPVVGLDFIKLCHNSSHTNKHHDHLLTCNLTRPNSRNWLTWSFLLWIFVINFYKAMSCKNDISLLRGSSYWCSQRNLKIVSRKKGIFLSSQIWYQVCRTFGECSPISLPMFPCVCINIIDWICNYGRRYMGMIMNCQEQVEKGHPETRPLQSVKVSLSLAHKRRSFCHCQFTNEWSKMRLKQFTIIVRLFRDFSPLSLSSKTRSHQRRTKPNDSSLC